MKNKKKKKIFTKLGPPPAPPGRMRFEGSSKLSNQDEHDAYRQEKAEWKRKFEEINK